MTNLDSILKSRDIALPTKVCLVKAMVFPVVRYRYETWTIKKAECWRIDAFELRSWRRFLKVPWTARRSNQSVLKENQLWIFIGRIDFEAKAPIFCPVYLIWKAVSLEKTLRWERRRAGEMGNRGWDGWMASSTQWTWVWANSRRWWRTRKPGVLQSMKSPWVSHDLVTE